MLDYRYQTFIELCHTKNYTRTAERLNLTQPAVSQHISYLQEHLNTQLVYYENKTVHITEAGYYLYEIIQNINNYTAKSLQEFQLLNKQIYITFGSTQTLAEYILAPLLNDFFDLYPHIKINLYVENTAHLLEKIKTGELDCAFIDGIFDQDIFSSFPFKHDEIVCVCSPKHPAASTQKTWSELFTESIFFREPGSGIFNAFHQLISQQQISLESFKDLTTVGNTNVIKSLIQANQGISFVYRSTVEKELEENTLSLIELPNNTLKFTFNMVSIGDHPKLAPVREYIIKKMM
ncbi:LysR family transcriptional regulator [uncultured Enterococcus sp.]|uniref:LysR family transcriptional regulator n=1 Tax=uncultured Enterococcus sp. TaxID=167972 RepID=UPI0025F1C682|nr:LysR family transcriptional regulator [uncultured Enterococcus sp.]